MTKPGLGESEDVVESVEEADTGPFGKSKSHGYTPKVVDGVKGSGSGELENTAEAVEEADTGPSGKSNSHGYTASVVDGLTG